MKTYFMMGKYSKQSLANASAERTAKVKETAVAHGGEIISIHALLGKYDLIIQVQLPGDAEAMKFSLELTKETGVAFTSSPAFEVDAFDKMLAK